MNLDIDSMDETPMDRIDDPSVREIFAVLPELVAEVAKLQRGELIDRSAEGHLAAAERAARATAIAAVHAWIRVKQAAEKATP